MHKHKKSSTDSPSAELPTSFIQPTFYNTFQIIPVILCMSVVLIDAGLNSELGTTTRKRFEDGWKEDPASIPTIQAIYYIRYSLQNSHSLAYDAYSRAITRFMSASLDEVEQYLFYSANRACNLVDNKNILNTCNRFDCRLCLNLKNEVSMMKASHFGNGVYTTAHSSKATADTKNIRGQSVNKVVVQCKVIVGNPKLLDQEDPSLTESPYGYQSVQSLHRDWGGSFIHPETIVYLNDAALPFALIVIADTLAPVFPVPPVFPMSPEPGQGPGPGPLPLLSVDEEIRQICENSAGRSHFFVYGSSGYKDSVRHFFESSAEVARSAVQPGSVEDVSKILKALAKWNAPFAIKGGGHATSPKFSSTTGIQIYMCKFDQVTYNPSAGTVDVGAGCLWDHVYIALEKYDRGVVGGATMAGVGVAGYLLGGGYSIKTNQYGLGIDNVVGFEVVLPDGRILQVKENDPVYGDLFVALKGGGSNFGIVTRFTLKTHYQGLCWSSRSGFIFNESESDRVKLALVNFAKNEKRKEAVVVGTFRQYFKKLELQSDIDVFCFFDGILPTGNNNPFKEFDAIKQTAGQQDDPNASGAQTLSSFREAHNQLTRSKSVRQPMVGVGETQRGRFACIMVTGFTLPLVNEMEKQVKESAKSMATKGGIRLLIDVWPFLPTIFDNSTKAAWPHKIGHAVSPLLAYYIWEGEENDGFWVKELKRALCEICCVAEFEGCTKAGAPIYLNTTLEDTQVMDIYRENFWEMGRTRAKYDPQDVMRNAGGFKIPLFTV